MIFAPIVMLMFFVYSGHDAIWPPWFLVTLAAVFYISTKLKAVPLIFAMLFFWVLFNGLIVSFYLPATAGVDKAQMIVTRNLSLQSTFEFFALSVLFLTLWHRFRTPMGWGFYIVGIIHCVWLIVDQGILHIETGTATIGLLGNRSIGATFAAIWMFFGFHFIHVTPEFAKKRHVVLRWLPLVALPAVLISSSGISFVALMLGLLVSSLAIVPSMWPLVFIVSPVVALGAATVKPNFWAHLSRYDAWPMFWKFWHEHFNSIFGSGLGTFKLWGPVSQLDSHFMEGKWWLWAHNDWLQIFLELGEIGFILSVVAYIVLLEKAKERPWLLGAVVTYGLTMLGNYPLRLAPIALLGFWLTFETLGEGDEQSLR